MAAADRLGVWSFAETIQIQQNLTDKDVPDFGQEAGEAPQRIQAERGRRITALTTRCGRGGDSMRMIRGIARNYMRARANPDTKITWN